MQGVLSHGFVIENLIWVLTALKQLILMLQIYSTARKHQMISNDPTRRGRFFMKGEGPLCEEQQ